MNYALDALWWKLTSQPVRDLASLLTAPPLWQSGCELSVRELLGEHGFRYLLALEANPAPLKEHLAQRAPFCHRLGIYAEELLAFWFANAPHAKLHAYNLPIFSDGQTFGAADFVVSLNQQPYHIELACKYYGGDQVQNLHGLNPKDTLTDKAAKLVQQSQLLHTPQGKATLTAQGLPENLLPAPSCAASDFFHKVSMLLSRRLIHTAGAASIFKIGRNTGLNAKKHATICSTAWPILHLRVLPKPKH